MKRNGIRYDETGRCFHCVEFASEKYGLLHRVYNGAGSSIEVRPDVKTWLNENSPGWHVTLHMVYRRQMVNLWLTSEIAATMFKMTFG